MTLSEAVEASASTPAPSTPLLPEFDERGMPNYPPPPSPISHSGEPGYTEALARWRALPSVQRVLGEACETGEAGAAAAGQGEAAQRAAAAAE